MLLPVSLLVAAFFQSASAPATAPTFYDLDMTAPTATAVTGATSAPHPSRDSGQAAVDAASRRRPSAQGETAPTAPTAPTGITAATAAMGVTAPTGVTAATAVTLPTGPVVNFAGQVLERGTRKPIADAQVVIADLGMTAMTDREGKFAFEDVPAGRYDIIIPLIGYQRYKTWEVLSETERTDVVYYVEPDYGSPLEIVVEADRVKKEVSKTTLKREEIRKIPGTGGDVIKVVTALPGVASSSELGSDLIIRGSGPFDNRIEIDRITVPYIYHFGGLRSVLSGDFVEDIDFQPGGFSADFGRATGGVLLANTRPGRRDRVGGGVDVNVAMAEGYVEGPLGDAKGSFMVAGRRSYFDIIVGPVIQGAVPKEQLELTVLPQFYDYQVRADYEVVTGTTVKAFLFGANDILSLLLKRTNPRDPDLTGDFLVNPFFHYATAGFQQTFDRYEHETLLFYGFEGQNLEIGTGNKLNTRNHGVGIVHDATYRFAKWNRLNAGAQLRYDTFKLDARFPQPPAPGQTDFSFSDAKLVTTKRTIKNSTIGLYVDDMIYVTEDWMLDPGVRIDYYTQDQRYYYVDPRLLTRWEATDTLTLKGAVGRYSDFPTGQELDIDFGTPDLEPFHSKHYVAGFEYKFTNADVLDVQAYYKWLDGLVYGFADAPRYRNAMVGEAYGVEVFLRHYLTQRWFGWLSYAYSKSTRKFPDTEAWTPAGFDQPHIFNAVGSYKITSRWEAGLKFRYSSGNPTTPYDDRIYLADSSRYIPIPGERNSERPPPTHRLDARVEYAYPFPTWMLRFYLEVWNVYGTENAVDYNYNYDYSSREPISLLPVPVPLLGVRAEF